jgi:DNA-binding NarL/FixJ family response regulator
MVRPSRPRVLIVDDDPAVGRSFARVLAAEAEVDVAGSSADALARIARGESFDLVVFVTGGATREEESRMRATGARCLSKPLAMDTVRQLLRP